MNNNQTDDTPIGPFTKENFVQQKWKTITDKIYRLNTTNEEETIPYIKDILKFLHELNASSDYNEYFGDPSIKTYFLRDFLLTNAKYLIATKNFTNQEALELSNNCLEQMAMFWVKAIHEDHPKLTEMAKTVFDIDRGYFKVNNQEEIIPGVVPSFYREPSKEHLDWINTLKKGDLIDCVKIDLTYKIMCWSHARVIDVLPEMIRISYIGESDKMDKTLDKTANANEIAPHKSKCKDFEWRMSLKKGDVLDACDTSHIWYNVTVLDVRQTEESEEKEVLIGYRVYDEDGDRYDQEGNTYFGWSSKYDEWMNVTNPRLSKKNSVAKKLFMNTGSAADDPVIEDSNDRVYSIEGGRLYALTRPGHSKSVMAVRMINNFGAAGGFDKILERISNAENWAPIEVVSLMVTLIGNINCLLHREFVQEYVPKLKRAVWKNLLKSPDSNIRNFTKERIDNIITAFDALLKRVYSLPEKNEMIESLSLNICTICFDSNFLERKLQGLKSFLELIRNAKAGTAKFLTTDYLNEYVIKNSIFTKIFGAKGHIQLIQRSADLLKFMINEGQLTAIELEDIWSYTKKGDTEAKLAVYKVLSELAVHLYTTHLDFIMAKVSRIAPEELIPEEIELIYELNRLSSKASGFSKKALGFYWDIFVDSSDQYSAQIAGLALEKYCDIMRGWDQREERVEAIYDCLKNIDKGVAVLPSLKIMKKLIDQYPVNATASDKFSKKTCVEHLCTEKNLLTIVMTDLKSFKNTIKRKIGNVKEVKEEDLNNLMGDRVTYLASIGERLQFILFVFANYESESGKAGLTYELLSELWDVMVNEAFLPGERDVVYKWIKETAESKAGFPMSIEDLLKFFQEKFNNSHDYQRMTTEGFNCFKNLFLIINEKLNKITKTASSGVVSYTQSSSYGVSYSSYSYNYEESKAAQGDFDYKVNVLPAELEGVQSIWNFILIAENESVAEKAIDFLNKLYLHVSADLESQIVYMRSEYLATCFKHLKNLLENKEKLDKKAFSSGCLRCVSLVRSIMDESEKKGIGKLKSHSGLVKGELLSFNVNNDATAGSDVPKKLELKLHSNTTVFELRVEIGRQIKATWDQIKLVRNTGQKEIKDNENGKTLGDIRIRNGETLTANKRPTPPIPQANLLQSDGSFNPLAKAIFEEWYYKFSENGKMNSDQCASFIHSCTNDFCKGDDKRVKEVFATYDKDRDGFLTVDDFLEFYYIACKQRPGVVWNNLGSHHYRNDLKKVTEVEEEKVDITSLTRYLISKNQEYFHLIFSLLDFTGVVANEAWKLLNRLPTSPEIFADILTLKGVKDTQEKNWNHILQPHSTYRLLYALHVLEYLMEDDESENDSEDEGDEGYFWTKDAKLMEYKKNWRADFIACGGFDQLFRVFELFSKKDHSTLTVFDKNILSFILKVLKNYLAATFASSVPYIYRSLSFVKLFLSLDFISNYIQTEQAKEVAGLEKQTSAVSEADNQQSDVAKAQTTKLQKKDSKIEEKRKEKLKIEETEEFKVLVERLRGHLGQQILAMLNLKDFVNTLATLSYDLLQKNGEIESEERMILEYSLSILVAILLYDRNMIKYFLNIDKKAENYQGADKLILEGIFCGKLIHIRRYFSHTVYVLCKYTTDFEDAVTSKSIINLFLNNLPASTSEEDSKNDYSQYFDLLCKLIEETYVNKKAAATPDSFDFKGLLDKVIRRIKDHVSIEKRQNLYLTDKIFTGLLNLCEKLIVVKPELRDLVGSREGHDLIKEIFEVCLFYIDEKESQFGDVVADDSNSFAKDYVKCKSRESRAIAYKLLITLCKGHPANLLMLLDSLKSLMGTILKYKTNQPWNYSPSSDTRSMHGYAGIRNLGCICYMNAMLQQFFMTPTFRYAILAADDKKEPNWVNKDNKFTIDDNVLHQLQQMFGFLEMTDRRDYNPHEFCFSFKDFTGLPVNVSEQQDTQEFLNTIFDRLENGLKFTPFRHILEGVYGGKTSNQIICHGCRSVRQREELFYNLSVEIKNMKTVYDSFEQFITGETIEDFFCESCSKKNSITKRTCLSYLPNVLIVHLKRIVFDLDTLMNQKINSRLEFPFDLNMEPYTAEGLAWREKSKEKEAKKKQKKRQGQGGQDEEEPREEKEEKEDKEEKEEEEESPLEKGAEKPEEDEKEGPYQLHPKDYYQYKLAGVVVHIGTAEIGHYYSYININRPNGAHEGTDKWLEFNDSTIKEFDVKTIEKECFGGGTGDVSDDIWGLGRTGGRENSKNAYILVYERVTKDPLKFVVDQKEDEAYLNKVLNIEKVLKESPEAVKISKEEVQDPKTAEKKVIENYNCDYFMLKKFIPSRIYKKVWEDNHKFMFERHIYNEDFFKFFKEVCAGLTLPAHTENIVNFINPDHVNFSPETKQNLRTLINILSLLIYFILSKSEDNKLISELSATLKSLLSLAPEVASFFFDNIVCKNLQSVLELFMNCPSEQVRQCTTQVILHSINVMISYHGFKLNLEDLVERGTQVDKMPPKEADLFKIEDAIVKFLRTLINYIPTDVAKNWTKLGQIFEFWRDFSVSGDVQMGYLFQQEFIAVLIDFYLEKKSPLVGYSEKKHTMGNQYVKPNFHPLVQTVAQMVQRAHIVAESGNIPHSSFARQGYKTFQLNENDYKCLTCREFYDRTLRDKFHPQALGIIIQHFAFENENFSYMITELLLQGLNKASVDECKSYLEVAMYFLNTLDFLQFKRTEWVLGFPQPVVTSNQNGPDSFGIYGNSFLDDAVIKYDSPLNIEGATSVLTLMLQNRKRIEHITTICLKHLLLLADINQLVFEYIISLPPPNYNYAKFTDWIKPFLEYFIVDVKRYSYNSAGKEELALEALNLWKSVGAKIEMRIDLNDKQVAKQTKAADQPNESQSDDLNKSPKTTVPNTPVTTKEGGSPVKEGEILQEKEPVELRGYFKTYIVGQTVKEELLDKTALTQTDEAEEVSLVTTEVACYITDSRPTGKGNLALPAHLVIDGRIKNDDVKPNSVESYFIKPKSTYPVYKQERVQQPAPTDVEAALRNNKAGDYGSDHEDYQPMQDVYRALKENDDYRAQEEFDTEVDEPGEQNPDTGRGDAGFSPESAVSQELDNKQMSNQELDNKADGEEKEKDLVKQEEVQEKEKEPETVAKTQEVAVGEVQQANHDVELEVQEGSELSYSVANMFRKFVIHNNTSHIANCKLKLVTKSTDFVNFRIPVSEFSLSVKPKTNSCILTLTKIFPQSAWGDYEVKCDVVELIEAPAAPKSDTDSGRKKNGGFYLKPIDLQSKKEDTDETRGAADDYYYY